MTRRTSGMTPAPTIPVIADPRPPTGDPFEKKSFPKMMQVLWEEYLPLQPDYGEPRAGLKLPEA